MKKKGNNINSNNITPIAPTNQYQISSFPIWEKVYLDLKEFKEHEDFFNNSMIIQCGSIIYIFPKNKIQSSKKAYYAIFYSDNETMVINEMDIECFYPIHDQGSNGIYLFAYDDTYMSDYRYAIVEFNIETKTFNYLQQKGVAPKARSELFTAFLLGGKIFFFGGISMFPGDNSGLYLFSFSIKESEWNIENYTGIYHNDNQNLPYISNTINVVPIQISKEKELLIGGKYFDDVFYSNITSQKIQNAK